MDGTCVSVVIPTADRPDELDRCLTALSRQTLQSLEIIVVDNTPGDARTAAVTRSHGARLVIEPNRGLCKARNVGARSAVGADIVAYLDDDSVPEPGWLDGIQRAFDDAQIMAVAGRTRAIEIKTEAQTVFKELRRGAYERNDPLVVSKDTPAWFEICAFGGIGAGCNMAVRRAAFDLWPGFHERTDRGTAVMGGGEHHAFLSLVELGYKVAYTPDAVVGHPYPATMDTLRKNLRRDLTASAAYMTLLFVEHPSHRKALLRYAFGGMLSKKRSWRPNSNSAAPKVVSRRERVLALASGPFRYLRGRL